MNAGATTMLGAAMGIVLGLTILNAAPATAQNSTPGIQQSAIPCTCRYAGRDYGQGQCVCLNTPSGPRFACCGKVLNNSAWNFPGNRCPVALNPSPDTPDPSLAPGHSSAVAKAEPIR